MAAIKVSILTRKDKFDEKRLVARITQVIDQAAEATRKRVDVEVTSDFGKFANISVNFCQTPIIIINDIAEFSGDIPKIEVMKQKLMSTTSIQEMF